MTKVRERTVFDGITNNENLRPRKIEITQELIDMWEESLIEREAKIARLTEAKEAHYRNILEAKKILHSRSTSGESEVS